ncbi:branched-chain-amino-acid aminotransferase TOXF [Metarhizium guizhouense ARSEF 977]|uniref:Branched-chain-amino-acid aminotransferase TOXF n=1 Tax=Metarhizium guizhouense (strain ARSEF 977) TaxID=1276136 RepID=A0A0B4GXF7_METGA|nr:branched-chain-amino-acid aminotransferase TOXF [Metarhizium guizhouense ARSEF 977]
MAIPAPKSDINWAKLQLTDHLPLNGHVEARFYQSTKQWTAPTLVTDPKIAISGISPALNYGQQCYEGLKAFRTPSDIVVFRPEFHAKRMAGSAAAVCLPPPPEELFLECIRMAVAANGEYVPPEDSQDFLYIRPVLFGSSDGLLLGPCDETIFAVYCHPAVPYHGIGGGIKGIVCEDFDRAAPKGVGCFKVGGNYSPIWRHAAKAMQMGYHITLHLDSATRTMVEEFATSAFLGHKLKNGRHVLVVPISESAIASVTSDSLVTLAERAGWTVERMQLPFSALGELDEVAAVGTAAAAVPIKALDRLSTGDKLVFPGSGETSNISHLASLMDAIQRGKQQDVDGWCWKVTGFATAKQKFKNSSTTVISNAEMTV